MKTLASSFNALAHQLSSAAASAAAAVAAAALVPLPSARSMFQTMTLESSVAVRRNLLSSAKAQCRIVCVTWVCVCGGTTSQEGGAVAGRV